MEVTLQYFDGCPNWMTTDRRLKQLIAEGVDATLTHELIASDDAAAEKEFRGSPTVLIDGADPFTEGEAAFGLACRVYRTEAGPAGSPTIEQLREAITRSKG